jgi:hypothetical protein
MPFVEWVIVLSFSTWLWETKDDPVAEHVGQHPINSFQSLFSSWNSRKVRKQITSSCSSFYLINYKLQMQKISQLPAFNLAPYAAVLSGKLSAVSLLEGICLKDFST